MGDYRRQVPEGVADILADECAVKREAEAAVRGVFLGHGLREVCTPAFEYLDVFSTGQAVLEQEQMFKLTDPKGRILVIRPDITIPIARMAATNMKGEPKPHKLFYISEVFRVNGNGADGLEGVYPGRRGDDWHTGGGSGRRVYFDSDTGYENRRDRRL